MTSQVKNLAFKKQELNKKIIKREVWKSNSLNFVPKFSGNFAQPVGAGGQSGIQGALQGGLQGAMLGAMMGAMG